MLKKSFFNGWYLTFIFSSLHPLPATVAAAELT